MGVNFAALYAYYLASPFNWLLILCPQGLIIEFMTYWIVVKIGLSGLSMTYYLQKHYDKPCFGSAFLGFFMRCPVIWRRIAGILCGWIALFYFR